jgi:hypothetical protein
MLSVVMALALATACSSGGNIAQQAEPSPSPSPSAPTSALKPMIQGLIDRKGLPPEAWLGHISGFVVNVSWSDLQPVQGAPIATDNAIDHAITQVRSLEPKGVNLGIKIRFFAGIAAPEWAKELGGSPVTIFDKTAGRGGTVGRFWTQPFGEAYASAWAQLAAKYDNVPEIRQIEVSRCGTVFDETLVRDTSDPQTVSNLLAAGFTFEADQQCLMEEVALGRMWRQTRIGLELNPYKRIEPDGTVVNDEPVTESLMDYCRQQLGQQCVLENNSIRWPPIAGDMGRVYSKMRELGPPIAFHTAIPSRVGDLDQTLLWAQQLGADAVELPSDYVNSSPTRFDAITRGLQANSA